MVASPTAASPDPFLTSLLITHFVKVAKIADASSCHGVENKLIIL